MTNRNNNNGEITLSRTLGLLDVTMIGVGAMIGAGIFVLTGIAAGHACPALVLAFILNGIVTTFTALSYAELGSCFPEAGGGYLWVKEGMGGTQGFLAGWMSWFAHAVACSLYGLGFGAFAVELLAVAFPDAAWLHGNGHNLVLIIMGIIVALFAFINFRGASETGLVGNVVTIAKVIILGVFIAVGIRAMIINPTFNVFTDNFLPNGIVGVFTAMGLTFIAFEGYEIIAQSGEEVKNPKRNVPRAIFISLVIVVIIYVLVAIVAIGAVQVPAGAGDIPVWEYLASNGELAIARAAEQLMPGWGGVLILISGLASTMSALNATIYSSSRVSFAMGRDHNLPEIFGRIHEKMHTPHYAVFISAVLIIIMAVSLPIEDVAKAADVMFLFMFAQVNITLMTLRQRRPDLDRGFFVPLFPWPPLIGIVSNMALAIFLAFEARQVGLVTIGWIAVGMLLYWGYFRTKEAMQRPKEVLLEEALVSVDYSVLLPVANAAQAAELGRMASMLARDKQGGVLALHVIKVPQPLSLSDGRLFLREGREPLQSVIAEAKQWQVPVHSMIRLGRDVHTAILKTSVENASDLIMFGWPGTSGTNDRLFGSVIDRIVSNPPADIAILRPRPHGPLRRILVPVAGGPNGRFVMTTAAALARNTPEETELIAVHVVPAGADPTAAQAQANNAFRRATDGLEYPVTTRVVAAESPVAGILQAAENCDLIVIGATSEPLFRNLLLGNVSERVADEAHCPVLLVKRRSSVLHSMLRETILPARRGQREV